MNVLQLVGIYFICCQVLIAFSNPQGNNIYMSTSGELKKRDMRFLERQVL